MTRHSTEPQIEALLSATHVRELIRAARGGFAPDFVGRALRNRYLEPLERDAAAIASLLGELAGTARARLLDAGVEPLHEEGRAPQKLPKREREYASNLAVLYSALAMALVVAGRPDEALVRTGEGLGWCRTAGDLRQEAVLWRARAAINERGGDYAAYVIDVVNELDASRRCGDPQQLIAALLRDAARLIHDSLLEDAEHRLDETDEVIAAVYPDGTAQPYTAHAMSHRSQIHLTRSEYPQSIHTLREALLTVDGTLFPMTRCSVLARLGSVYLELSQYRQCIECQHEVVRLAEEARSDMIRGWGYMRLADVYLHLKEHDRAEETLRLAAECSANGGVELRMMIDIKRAQAMLAAGRFDEARDIAGVLLASITDGSLAARRLQLWMIAGRAEEGSGRYDAAAGCFRRALEIAERAYPARAFPPRMCLAAALHAQERTEEAAALLATINATPGLTPEAEAEARRLQAAIAEGRGDLRAALEFERRAFELERMLLERKGEQSLRNARVMAETDLLEREAELERERRMRLERELADAVVELSDRRQRAQTVEKRLRGALTRVADTKDHAVASVLSETLGELRAGAPAVPLRSLGRADAEFQRRLRERCPDLTPKQERLCGLLRAGLASKEIAAMLGIGEDAVKAQRKRLRRKLGLAPDENLEKVLGEL